MPICLAHISALQYWRHARRIGCAPNSAKSSVPSSIHAAEARLALQSEVLSGVLEGEVHLVVVGQSARRDFVGMKVHSVKSSVPGDAAKIADDIYVLSPASLLMQLSRTYPFEQIALLAYEFCGSYVLDVAAQCGFRSAAPVVSRAKLLAAAALAGSFRGSTVMRRVLEVVADGSASPAESALAVLLCAKRMYGGYGLPLPNMNYRVNVRGEARKMTPSRYFLCDLCWPAANLDVEYDSDAFHLNSASLSCDAARRNALAALGFQTVTVTRAQMRDADMFDDAARAIAKILGVRLRAERYSWPARRSELRRNVLGPSIQ